ncbi:hypothetical protein Tco_0641371 [Tanacetum coccineum]
MFLNKVISWRWLITLEEQEEDDEEELTTSSGMNLQLGNESLIYVDNHHFSPSDYEATNLLRSPISLKTSKHRPIKSGSSSSSSSNPTPENNTLGLADYFLQSEVNLDMTVASHNERFGDDETGAAESSANRIASVGTFYQLDESRFILDANLLREALEITPIDQAHQFVSPLPGDAIMDFVNELGYIEEIHFVSKMAMNNLDHPWRAILSMINQCLTGKTSGFNRPRCPPFLVDKANLSIAPQKGKKTKLHVIPYCQFTKLIIYHLGRTHNIHQRSASPFHLAEEDHRLGNLKFISKGEDDKVFGMLIPKELISNNIRNTPYNNAYLEMVAKQDQKTTAEKKGKKKSATAKQIKPKPVKEKLSKLAHAPKPKDPLQLIDEDEPTKPEPEPEPEHQGEAEATRPLPVVEGKGKAIATEEQAAQSLLALHTPKRRSITDQFIFQRRTLTTEEASIGPSAQLQDDASANIVHNSPSLADAETGADIDKTNSGGNTEILQIDQAGPDPGKIHVALAGPNPEPMHEDFMANVYPNVHESLKFPADEHVILEDPLSSSRTLSSMKNLDDAYTIGD